MASQKLLMLPLLCVMAVAVSARTEYPTWSLGVSNPTIYLNVGDSVFFNYPPKAHTVLAVYDQTDYDDCNTGAAYAEYSSGQDTITFYNTGTNYFICGIETHCANKMKVTVVVQ